MEIFSAVYYCFPIIKIEKCDKINLNGTSPNAGLLSWFFPCGRTWQHLLCCFEPHSPTMTNKTFLSIPFLYEWQSMWVSDLILSLRNILILSSSRLRPRYSGDLLQLSSSSLPWVAVFAPDITFGTPTSNLIIHLESGVTKALWRSSDLNPVIFVLKALHWLFSSKCGILLFICLVPLLYPYVYFSILFCSTLCYFSRVSFGIVHPSALFLPSVFPFWYSAYLLSTSWNLSLIRRLRTASLFLRASELLLLFHHLLWWTSKYVPISCNDCQNFTKYFWPLARSICTYL